MRYLIDYDRDGAGSVSLVVCLPTVEHIRQSSIVGVFGCLTMF